VAAQALTHAQARRSLTAHRRLVRRDISDCIRSLERELQQVAAGFLPVRIPPSWTPEAGLARLLRDERGRSLRLFGEPVLRRESPVALDELLTELEHLAWWQRESVRPEDLLGGLADHIRQVGQLRGRGGRYGAIRNGIELAIARQLAHSDADDWLALGRLDGAAQRLHVQIDAELSRPAESSRVTVLRRLYFWLVDHGRPDTDFAEIFADAWLVELIMMDARRPRWCTWQRLAADYLGILPNTL